MSFVERMDEMTWYAHEDFLSGSKGHFLVHIHFCPNRQEPYYRLDVYFDSRVILSYQFTSIAVAVAFAQEIIGNSFTVEQIKEGYQKMMQYPDKKPYQKLPRGKTQKV